MAGFRRENRRLGHTWKQAMLLTLAASLLCFPLFSRAFAAGEQRAQGEQRPLGEQRPHGEQRPLGDAVYSADSVLAAAQRKVRTGARRGMASACGDVETLALSAYDDYARNAAYFERVAEQWESAAAESFGLVMPNLSAMLNWLSPANYEALWPENAPSWKCAAALCKAYGPDAYAAVISSLRLTLADTFGARQVGLSFGSFCDMAGYGTEEQFLTARFAYAYLCTVYDDAGVSHPTEKRTYDQAYLDGLRNPLPGCTIKDCWFDPRDHGTRLHTGADIRASARAHIRSVTDGVVLYVGYLPVPGNYVVIRDPAGYEYHYYHMVQESKQVREGDSVKAGDCIGLVGNTGNSAANHLHVAVIAPDDQYVNPYDLFLQAGFHPIKKS